MLIGEGTEFVESQKVKLKGDGILSVIPGAPLVILDVEFVRARGVQVVRQPIMEFRGPVCYGPVHDD
jgi:hypothetical protein